MAAIVSTRIIRLQAVSPRLAAVNLQSNINVAGTAYINSILASTVTSGAAYSADPSLQSWTTSIAFSSVSATQVNWGAGALNLGNGLTYAIVSGNTGAMAALTYIYLDIAVSTTVLQTTTTFSTASGAGKLLIAAAQNHTVSASCIPFSGQQPIVDGAQISARSITAGAIATGTLTASEIAANTITGSQISSLNISTKSITADTGTIGGLTLATTSMYTGAKTAYNDTNAGVHYGTDGIGFGNNVLTISAAGAVVATNISVTGGNITTTGHIYALSSAAYGGYTSAVGGYPAAGTANGVTGVVSGATYSGVSGVSSGSGPAVYANNTGTGYGLAVDGNASQATVYIVASGTQNAANVGGPLSVNGQIKSTDNTYDWGLTALGANARPRNLAVGTNITAGGTIAATSTIAGSNLSATFTGSAGGSASGTNTGDNTVCTSGTATSAGTATTATNLTTGGSITGGSPTIANNTILAHTGAAVDPGGSGFDVTAETGWATIQTSAGTSIKLPYW